MIGFRCECSPAIDCTYPKCKEGVETNGKDLPERLQDYARDYTTTTYHDDLIREAVTETKSLRQQVTLLRNIIEGASQIITFEGGMYYLLGLEERDEALAATQPKEFT